MDVDRRDQPGHLPVGCAVGILPAAVAALLAVWQVLVHFADCEIGINSSANLFSLLLFVWPPLTLACTLLFGLIFAVVRTWSNGGLAVVAGLGFLVVAAVVTPYLVLPLLVPADYPAGCS